MIGSFYLCLPFMSFLDYRCALCRPARLQIAAFVVFFIIKQNMTGLTGSIGIHMLKSRQDVLWPASQQHTACYSSQGWPPEVSVPILAEMTNPPVLYNAREMSPRFQPQSRTYLINIELNTWRYLTVFKTYIFRVHDLWITTVVAKGDKKPPG
jgi:hypothetical protein